MVGGEGLLKWWEERVCGSGGRRGSVKVVGGEGLPTVGVKMFL